MAVATILTNFSRYRDADLDQKAGFIIDSMTDNAHFPDPVPAIAELTAANEAYIAACSAAETGDRQAVAIKNQKRADLEYLLSTLGLYVKAKAKKDETILISSGYSLRKSPEPVGILAKPENFRVHVGEVGMIKLHLNRIRGAFGYQYEYRIQGQEQWVIKVHTRSNILLTGLQSGSAYEFRAAGIGAASERVYSDVLKSFVL